MSDFQNVKDGRPFPPLSALAQPEPDTGTPAGEFDGLKVDELKAKIADLNAERDGGQQVVPVSTKKADLIAALEDAKNSAADTAAASMSTPGAESATTPEEGSA